MQFWDSSALLPLVVRQAPFSDPCRRAFRREVSRAIAFLARVECRSAIERLAREGTLNSAARRRSLTKIDKLVAAFDIVAFSPEVEAHALALLGRHPLRSLDALQLGCAQGLASQDKAALLPDFVCCDRRLAEAAAAEGFPLAIGP
jgi:predicted nucleic acid-binding protein